MYWAPRIKSAVFYEYSSYERGTKLYLNKNSISQFQFHFIIFTSENFVNASGDNPFGPNIADKFLYGLVCR